MLLHGWEAAATNFLLSSLDTFDAIDGDFLVVQSFRQDNSFVSLG